MTIRALLLLTLVAGVTGVGSGADAPPGALVENGSSAYSIYYLPGSPDCVADAAREIQRVLRVATGVTLPIRETPVARMIALGDSPAAREAGIIGNALASNAFVIRTVGESVFVVGRDIAPGKERWNFEWSNGTYLGAVRFLEHTAGARWLAPGEWGEDVPAQKTIRVPAIDLAAKPRFDAHVLTDLRDKDERVIEWKRRYGIWSRLPLGWAHSFDDHPDVAVLKDHPEYMALQQDGKRLPVPQGKPYDKYPTWKYCLTNPGLVQAFADSIIASFDTSPKRLGDACSPSDGPFWCVCPECMKWTAKGDMEEWPGSNPNVASRTAYVLQWYNAVARLVAAKHPDRVVGALVYQHYLYPPKDVVKLEPNIVLGVALSTGYGFKFYRPERAEEAQRLLSAWSRVSSRMGYSDYTTWMRNWFGFPVPSGRPLLKMIFPVVGDSCVRYVVCHGMQAWGYGALNNYLAAKLLWDPKADVDALSVDFLRRAYGPAAETMDRMDRMLEEGLKQYILTAKNPDHELAYEMVKAVWAPRWADMERLYGEAEAAALTPAQRKRLEMFGDNLVLAHHNLRKAGLARNPEKSRFYRSDEALEKFMAERKDSLAMNDFAEMTRRSRGKQRPVLVVGWKP